jgi:hypothetical protein
MVKKALVVSATLITIIVIISIIISIINLKTAKPAVFRSVVSYDSEVNTIVIAPQNSGTDNNNIPLISNMLRYESTITISTVILVIIFLLLFYGTKRSKGW